MAAPGFWDNQEKAQAAVGQLKSLKTILKPLEETLQSSDDLAGLLEMAAEDEGFAAEVTAEISKLERVLDELELTAMLDGPNDAAGALNAAAATRTTLCASLRRTSKRRRSRVATTDPV